MIQFAQNVPPAVSGGWLWGFVGVCVAGGAIVFFWNQVMRALGKDRQQISPQPLAIEITKQLHEQFASKPVFEDHVEHNTERHGQLFNRIDKVEREARKMLDERFAALGDERRESLKELNDQFVFIRENLAAINNELKLRRR